MYICIYKWHTRLEQYLKTQWELKKNNRINYEKLMYKYSKKFRWTEKVIRWW